MFQKSCNNNMIRLCWVLVLVAVVFPLYDARPHKCEQRERSLADLDLAEDSLNRAKQLYPNCEEGNEGSNSSECSKKDKSLGFIDVALDLVSNAKKNIPICPHVPTEKPSTTTAEPPITTEEPSTATEEPSTATEEPSTATEEPSTATEETSTLTEEPSIATEEPSTATEDIRSPMDCQDLQAAGNNISGTYFVWPIGGNSFRVRCDMDTDGGGWTVIQRRGKFSKQLNFDENWNNYQNGFGNVHEEFWLGNDNIFALSNQGAYSLRMDMTAADGETAYAVYREFRIEDEVFNYKLHVGGYNGTAGDCLKDNNRITFSTKDGETTYTYRGAHCTQKLKGGFWYQNCGSCNPNGLYMPGERSYSSMNYHEFKGQLGLASMDMKLKRL